MQLLFAAPPSYEECTVAAGVDIREDDDNEYVRGDLKSWRPRYPIYRQLSEPHAATASSAPPPLALTQLTIEDDGL